MNFPAVPKTYYLLVIIYYLLFLSCLRPFHGIALYNNTKTDGKTLYNNRMTIQTDYDCDIITAEMGVCQN